VNSGVGVCVSVLNSSVQVEAGGEYAGDVSQFVGFLLRGFPHGNPETASRIRVEAGPEGAYCAGPSGNSRMPLSAGPFARTIPSALQRQLLSLSGDLRLVHAGAVVSGAKALILAGPSKSGKSTTTLALCSRGHRFYSDEFAVFRPRDRMLLPFPMPAVMATPHAQLTPRLRGFARFESPGCFSGEGVTYYLPPDAGTDPVMPNEVTVVIFDQSQHNGDDGFLRGLRYLVHIRSCDSRIDSDLCSLPQIRVSEREDTANGTRYLVAPVAAPGTALASLRTFAAKPENHVSGVSVMAARFRPDGQEPVLVPLTPARGLLMLALNRIVFDEATVAAGSDVFRYLSELGDLLGSARFYRLRSGDLELTAARLEKFL
jgi:hypothetical protein